MTNDTEKIFQTGEMVRLFTQSDGWRYAKDRLKEKIKMLDSISSVTTDGRKPEDVLRELESRVGAKAIIEQWISEIEGLAEQAKDNKKIIIEQIVEEEHRYIIT